jgi:hypothetical protein
MVIESLLLGDSSGLNQGLGLVDSHKDFCQLGGFLLRHSIGFLQECQGPPAGACNRHNVENTKGTL